MPSFFGTKKKEDTCGDFNGMMCLVFRCSSMKALQVSISWGLREYIFAIFETKVGWGSMAWS